MFCQVWVESDCQKLNKKIITVEHKCVLCEAELESKEALQEHFRKHANKEIDGRGKPQGRKIQKKPNKTDELCDICGKTFESITATIRHRFKMHPNSPAKFYCSYCGKQFPLKTHRDNHMTTHNPEESKNTSNHKKCEECDIVFYNLKALNYHYRSIHKRLVHIFQPIATPPPSNKIKVNSMNDALSVYYCHICGVEYIVKFNLQQHLEKVHTREERERVPDDLIKCTMCAALFCSKKAYEVHNSYHQPDDLYVTSEEQRLQTITKIDQDFDIRRVKPTVDKYIPKLTGRRPQKRRRVNEKIGDFVHVTIKEEDKSDDEGPGGSQSCQSDSDSDVPLQKRLLAS
ncbi:zinc finger and BTB domain-containing protein 16-A [Diachasma alloeum]|uniref:zinc finger and BTB domain-containing protein 16-A n=1 Tax=Diachasma alloeum TaxID=454923 RepID=UPI0007384E06|nr:zinc finger and BTB domain-containing protein 16-A [Diachasma alloeum]